MATKGKGKGAKKKQVKLSDLKVTKGGAVRGGAASTLTRLNK